MKICAMNPIMPEYSLCGDAFDAPDDPACSDMEPFEIAKRGQVVTCEECKLIIREIRDTYPRGYKCN